MSCQRKDILMLHLFRGERPVCPISQVSQSPGHIYGLLGPSGRRMCELRAVPEKSLPSFLHYSSRNRSVCLLSRKNNLPPAMQQWNQWFPKGRSKGAKRIHLEMTFLSNYTLRDCEAGNTDAPPSGGSLGVEFSSPLHHCGHQSLIRITVYRNPVSPGVSQFVAGFSVSEFTISCIIWRNGDQTAIGSQVDLRHFLSCPNLFFASGNRFVQPQLEPSSSLFNKYMATLFLTNRFANSLL